MAPLSYNRILLVRQPTHRVWNALQNDLPSVGAYVRGIASIRRIEMTRESDGNVRTVHVWTAATGLPPSIEASADPRALTWIERTEWDERSLRTVWAIESHLLGRMLTAQGSTTFMSAMGNRGTRLQISLSTTVEDGSLGPFERFRLSFGIADAASTVLTKTVQDLCTALEAFLSADNATQQRHGGDEQRTGLSP